MKYISTLLASFVLALTAGIAQAEYIAPDAICSTEMTYIIRDAAGKEMDRTTYRRDWAVDCVTQVQIKYAILDVLFGKARSNFEAMTGRKVK